MAMTTPKNKLCYLVFSSGIVQKCMRSLEDWDADDVSVTSQPFDHFAEERSSLASMYQGCENGAFGKTAVFLPPYRKQAVLTKNGENND